MNYLKLLKLVLTFANALLTYVKEKQLIEAGKALAIEKGLKDAKKAIDSANNARRDALIVFDESRGVFDESDPNLRD